MAVSGGPASRCVLVFHRVLTGPLERAHDLLWTEFEELLDQLGAARSTVRSDLAAAPADGATILTFDDTSSDHLRVAEAMTQRGLSGVFFATVGALGTPGHLSSGALRDLAAGGHVIGSHGWSHVRLDRLTSDELETEIVASRAFLEDLLGTSVRLFAPAGGIEFDGMAERLEAAGYVASRSTRWGIHRRLDDRWHIPTVPATHTSVDRGWAASAVIHHRLPIAMVALSAVRNTIRPDVWTSIRGRILGSTEETAAKPTAED